jgi:hypothetical protein
MQSGRDRGGKAPFILHLNTDESKWQGKHALCSTEEGTRCSLKQRLVSKLRLCNYCGLPDEQEPFRKLVEKGRCNL